MQAFNRYGVVVIAATVKCLEMNKIIPDPTEVYIHPSLTSLEKELINLLLMKSKINVTPKITNLGHFHYVQSMSGDSLETCTRLLNCSSLDKETELTQNEVAQNETQSKTQSNPLITLKISPHHCMSAISGQDLLHQAIIDSSSEEDSNEMNFKFYMKCLTFIRSITSHLPPHDRKDEISSKSYPPFTLWIDLGNSYEWLRNDDDELLFKLGDILNDMKNMSNSSNEDTSYTFIHSAGLFPWRALTSIMMQKEQPQAEMSSIVLLNHMKPSEEEIDIMLSQTISDTLLKENIIVKGDVTASIKELIGFLTDWRKDYVEEIVDESLKLYRESCSVEEEGIEVEEENDMNISISLEKACKKFERKYIDSLKHDMLKAMPIAESVELWKVLEFMCSPQSEEEMRTTNTNHLTSSQSNVKKQVNTDMKHVLMVLGAMTGDNEEEQRQSTQKAMSMLKKLMLSGYVEAIPSSIMFLPQLPVNDDKSSSTMVDAGEGENFQVSILPPVINAYKSLNEDKGEEEVAEFQRRIEDQMRWSELVEHREMIDKDALQLVDTWNSYYKDRTEEMKKKYEDEDEKVAGQLELVQRELSMLVSCSTLAMRRKSFISALSGWKAQITKDGDGSRFVDLCDKFTFVNDKIEEVVKSHVLSMIETRNKDNSEKEAIKQNQQKHRGWKFWK